MPPDRQLGPSHGLARLAALLLAALVVGVTVRFNIFVAWGTDSAAYLLAAHRWAASDVFAPATFVFWAPWHLDGFTESPLGHLPGPIKGTVVGMYPPGYPWLLAVAVRAGGTLAAYAVAPLAAGVLVWCAYVLAARLSSAWAGVAAAALTASSPVTLANAITPMSDVPATACWAVAWVMSLRAGVGAAIAAGSAAALAVLIRPNLAPLALVVAALAAAVHATTIGQRLTRLMACGIVAATGPALLLWSQAALYGSPFESGYTKLGIRLSAEHIATNLTHYPGLVIGMYGWPLVAGVVALPLLLRRQASGPAGVPAAIVSSALAIVGVNYLLYLPYFTFEGWYWLRFLLPALLALFVLFAGGVDRLARLTAARSRVLAVAVAAALLLPVLARPRQTARQLLDEADGHRRVQLMGHYLREALPPRAVILSYLQSGAAAFYTGRSIVRLDMVAPASLDALIDDLWRRGHRPVFMIDDAMEREQFRTRFPTSRYRRLDWPARAGFWSVTPIWYLDPADRLAFLNGERYPADVLAFPAASASYEAPSPPAPSPFPPPHESLAFRRSLDVVYRNTLGRPAGTTTVALVEATAWLQRYLRYRLYGCGHGDAQARVFRQIEAGDVPGPCALAASGGFPPRDEIVAFRERLEAWFRGRKRPASWITHTDREGEAIWMAEYLRYRAGGCSHTQAADRVTRQIAGRAPEPTCG